MGDISNIIDLNVSHSTASLHNSNDCSVSNDNANNGCFTTGSPSLTHSTPVEKDMMTGINNNIHEEYLYTDMGATMTESSNSLGTSNLNVLGEATYSGVNNDIFKTFKDNSSLEIETKVETIPNDSFSKTVNLSLESAVKNDQCAPLKQESSLISPVNTSKLSADNSKYKLCPETMDIVDFSFKESEGIFNDISGNLANDLVSEVLGSSRNNSIVEVINDNTVINVIGDLAVSDGIANAPLTLKEAESSTMNMDENNIESKSGFEILGNFIDPVCTLSSSKNVNNVPVVSCNVVPACKVLGNPINTVIGDFSNADSVMKVPEIPINNTAEDFSSPDFVLKVPENGTDKLNKDICNDEIKFKVTECPSNKQADDFSNINSVSKLPENPINILTGDLSTVDALSIMAVKPLYKSGEDLSIVGAASTVLENPSNEPVGDFSVGAGIQVIENSSSHAVDFSDVNSISRVLESSVNQTGDFSNVNSASKVLENPVNHVNDFSNVNSKSKVPENPVNKLTGDFSTVDVPFIAPEKSLYESVKDFSVVGAAFKVLENPNIKHTNDFSNVNSEFKVPENPINKPSRDFSTVDEPSIVPENPIYISAEDFSAGTESQMSRNPYRKSINDFSNASIESEVPGISINEQTEIFPSKNLAFKVPENSINKPLEFSDAGCNSLKSPENIVNNASACISNVDSTNKDQIINAIEQFPNEDITFKVADDQCNNPIDQVLEVDFGFKIPDNPVTNECDEEFTDAVQFFKDPNSFQFLENIKTSVQQESSIPRSSLYVKFDPLHSKFSPNMSKPDNCALISAAVNEMQKEVSTEKSSPEPKVVNKHFVDINVRESTGNVLISFDSPKPAICKSIETPEFSFPPKLYTEDEFQQKLKIHELTMQEVYLKKQREMESQIIERDNLLKIQKVVIEDLLGVLAENSDLVKKIQTKVEVCETENKKLVEDLKTTTEDLQSVENTFADFHKRYEQCKGMLKTYKENEEHLKQVISDLQTKVKEHEQTYCMLQERTEELLEKANIEVAGVKRTGEAQVTVLKAQLKKAEMKISSLESDIKQIKIENSQLGGICDDLMAKADATAYQCRFPAYLALAIRGPSTPHAEVPSGRPHGRDWKRPWLGKGVRGEELRAPSVTVLECHPIKCSQRESLGCVWLDCVTSLPLREILLGFGLGPVPLPGHVMGQVTLSGWNESLRRLLVSTLGKSGEMGNMATTKEFKILAPKAVTNSLKTNSQSWADRVEYYVDCENVEKSDVNTNINNTFRFFLVKRETDTFATISPFLIQKGIQGMVGTVKDIKKLRSGDLLVEVCNSKQAQLVMSIKTLGPYSVTTSPHRNLNYSRGVVSSRDLENVSEEEILENLQGQLVCGVWRITIRRDGKVLNTQHLILIFSTPTLPQTVQAAYLRLSVRPYIPNPLRCFNCQRYGHSKNACRGQLTCARCTATGHESVSCNAAEKCVNYAAEFIVSRGSPRSSFPYPSTGEKIRYCNPDYENIQVHPIS
ncbi:transforming acidic coiled-coil-containing protein 3 [Nephila pilipes]|uniref:Transforming acidic coiled-coil-containing protein 3 n=1 Tax=Nephila pilipes TaxID=299642 RepID=A0A8X6T9Y6_NEPPI|nr:transforming acidic coiled-coil-containing protein 3 [Nephila pilipes]